MKPTARLVVLMAAGAPLALTLILLDARLWPAGLIYAIGVGGLMAADLVMAPGQRQVSATLIRPHTIPIGDTSRIGIDLAYPPDAQGAGEVVVDVDGPTPPLPLRSFLFDAAENQQIALDLTPTQRGVVALKEIWLRWHGPLGLAWRIKRQTATDTLPVIPNTRPIRRDGLRLGRRASFHGIKAQTDKGQGTAFDSMRDFVPGLDHRAIDWKHSARHRKLVCKEYEVERNHQIVLAVDTGRQMSEPISGVPRLDHGINAALLLAYVSLRHGDRIGLFNFDAKPGQYLDPVSRIHDFPILQERAARLAYSESETNYTLGLVNLGARLRRRSLIVLFTEFVDTVTAELMIDNLRRLAKRHLILFVSLGDIDLRARLDAVPDQMKDVGAAVVAHGLAQERDRVYERLRRMGVQCLETHDASLAVDLVNQYLDIKNREMV